MALGNPGAGDAGFPLQALVRFVLDDEAGTPDWETAERGFWCRVGPVEQERRVQGWKLHVSATPLSAPEVLVRAARVLVRHGCPFKFAARAAYVEELTGIRYDRAQCGKFITAYPSDDDQFRALAEELDRATAGLPGPHILSDRPYRPGSLVHYRYGAFRGVPHLTHEGVHQARLQAPDGSAVEDLRTPWFAPPAWAELPFPGPPGRPGKAPSAPRQVLLRDRYAVHDAIRHSARGGVYRAVDRQTGDEVIVKEARAHVGSWYTGLDARDALRAEATALTGLAGLGPDLVELFDHEDRTFLVEAVVPGTTLTRWVGERFDALPDPVTGPPLDDIRDIALRLTRLLGEIHDRGLVYRDFTPNNVMVTPDGELRLIDPEFVARPGEWGTRAYTPGYGAPEYADGPRYGPAPGFTVDLFSLGATLFFMATGVGPAFAGDEPADRRTVVERLDAVLALTVEHNTAARTLAPAVRGLCAQDPADRWSPERLVDFLEDQAGDQTEAHAEDPRPVGSGPLPRSGDSGGDPVDRPVGFLEGDVEQPRPVGSGSLPRPRDPVDDPVDRLVDDGLAHVLATTADDGAERLWQSTPFGDTTDPCNVQHGAAGVLVTLAQADAALARPDLRAAMARTASWLTARLDTPGARPPLPGLYFGRAGTAWALHDTARRLDDAGLAERAERLALALPLRWENPDLFHGAAGAGLTQLRLWRATGREEFLDRAAVCADGLAEVAVRGDDGVFWPIPADFDSALAGITHLGYAHGVAGVGAFLLEAALATGREDLLDLAREAGDTLTRSAERGVWGARWRTDRTAENGTGMLYHLCSGASGVGTFLLRLWRATGEDTLRELAEEAATAVHRARTRTGTAVCHGLAGNGDFLLDMDQSLGGPYRAMAEDLAATLHTRHALRDGRALLPDESGTRITVDYGVGLAGTVSFLLRLRHGGPRPLLDDAGWPGQRVVRATAFDEVPA
ncbi:class IV lanthionine synthetase LanL [Streptomyces sp. NPDC002680]|uniref:class IV lanthionine synthetase LanL n=1 Tax=Streptomyces sp. NPDC002680 TaxID=3364659 RepID=UPI00369AACC2